MLIRDWIARLYGDFAHDWTVLTVLLVMVLLVIWLSAEGVLSVGRRAESWARDRVTRWHHRRSARLAIREPGRALAANDDHHIWRETTPERRPRCEPRRPRAAEVNDFLIACTRLCRDAATVRHDDG